MFKITRSFFSIPSRFPKTSQLHQILPKNPLQNPLYSFSIAHFSSNQQKPNENQEDKEEQEYIKRKKQLEERELKDLKKQLEKGDANFSLYSELFKIVQNKVLLFVLLGAGCFLGYQFYTFTERIHDPIDNENKIVFLKYSYEKKLAKAMADVFRNHFTIMPKTHPAYAKFDELYKKVQENADLQALNLAFNGDINIIDRDDTIFFLLPNGSLFISSGILPFLKDDKSFMLLMMIELSHIYLRTNAQNVNLADVWKVIQVKKLQFNASRIRDPQIYNMVKSLNFLTISKQQEDKMMQIMPSFMEVLGYKVDAEKDMKPLLEKLSAFDRKINNDKTDVDRKSENFFKKHPALEC